MEQSQYEVAFYKWALVDLEREVNEGFPLIRGFRSNSVVSLQIYVHGLDKSGVREFIRGLVGRSHAGALATLGLSLTDGEKARVEEYLTVCSARSERELPSAGKELRSRLRKMIKPAFADDELGGVVDSKSGVYVLEKLVLDRWKLRTHIDTGIRGADLTYINAIRGLDGERIEKGTSILEWMGIRGQSEWIGYGADEAGALLDSLKSVVGHYMNAVVPLLERAT